MPKIQWASNPLAAMAIRLCKTLNFLGSYSRPLSLIHLDPFLIHFSHFNLRNYSTLSLAFVTRLCQGP